MTLLPSLVAQPKDPKRPLLVAHRGASHAFPENTWKAFEQALTVPVDGIELDLQLSLDERVVVFHDRTLVKTGKRYQRVRNWRADDLRDLRLRGEPIPFFEEILEPLASRCVLLLEIKRRESASRRDRLQRLTEIVLETVLARNLAQRICLLCFDEQLLRWAHQRYPHFRYVLNQDRPQIIGDDSFLFAYSIKVGQLTPDFGAKVHARNKLLMTFTVNGRRQLAHAMRAEADVIMSDKPAWLVDQFQGNRHDTRPKSYANERVTNA